MPFGKTRVADRDNRERHSLQRLLLFEYSNFGTLDEARVVAVHPELDDGGGRAPSEPADGHGDWIRRDAQPPARLQIVEAEVDLGIVERDVGAALDVGGTAARVIDGLALDGNAHHLQ